jgi:hypothetical protein
MGIPATYQTTNDDDQLEIAEKDNIVSEKRKKKERLN